MCVLWLMVGCPGSGKTTWIKENLEDASVCSADHFFVKDGVYAFDFSQLGRAHAQCLRGAEAAMNGQAPLVVVDNTLTRARERKPYLTLAERYGYAVRVKVFPLPPENRNVHGVPWDQVQKMHERIQILPGIYGYENGELVPLEET